MTIIITFFDINCTKPSIITFSYNQNEIHIIIFKKSVNNNNNDDNYY